LEGKIQGLGPPAKALHFCASWSGSLSRRGRNLGFSFLRVE
jgi:hypothetical protein